VKIRLTKEGNGKMTVHARRTRAWERRTMPIQGVPQGQLGPAVADLVKRMRDDHRPVRLPGLE